MEREARHNMSVQALQREIRGFGVILEDINGKFDILLEAMRGVTARMDGLESRMDRLEARMNGLETRMNSLENDMRTGFTMVWERFDYVDAELAEIRGEINTLWKQKADTRRVDALECRVGKLEERAADQKEKAR